MPFEEFQTPSPGLTMSLWSEPQLPLSPDLYNFLPIKFDPNHRELSLVPWCYHTALKSVFPCSPWWNIHPSRFMGLIPTHPSGFNLMVFLPEVLFDPLSWTFISLYKQHSNRIGFIYLNMDYKVRKDRDCVCLQYHSNPST